MNMGEPRLAPQSLSVEDYLASEEVANERHEFIDGVVYAMVGITLIHNQLAGAIYSALRSQLKLPCRAYMTDVKLRIETRGATIFYYPDVMVTCSKQNLKSHWIDDPRLLVEVLSPSTERIDRNEKLMAYQQIPSLQDYLLVAQDQTRIEVLSREADWKPRFHGPGDMITLAGLGVTLALDTLYAEA
jgi:Uma2 family endonuclease